MNRSTFPISVWGCDFGKADSRGHDVTWLRWVDARGTLIPTGQERAEAEQEGGAEASGRPPIASPNNFVSTASSRKGRKLGAPMNHEANELTARLVLALQIAREAGKITLEYFRRDDLEVERKGDDSPVTIADRRAEEHLRNRIAEAFAHDAVVGEELTDRPGNSPFRWIVDPIDGTKVVHPRRAAVRHADRHRA